MVEFKCLWSSVGLFSVVNKGYNITQFYGIAAGDGAVMRTQDNGTQHNDHTELVH